MKFEHTKVFNFEGAFRGLRNPIMSHDKSDSYFGLISKDWAEQDWDVVCDWTQKKYPNEDYEDLYENHTEEMDALDQWIIDNGILEESIDYDLANVAFIGPNDIDLAQRLIKAGPEHRKFLRQIFVSVDITAPLYWWKEFDTYKVGTTANSSSTMHKLASTPITLKCFETDDLIDELHIMNEPPLADVSLKNYINNTIHYLEKLRQKYNETKDVKYWKELIRWLPESWLQTRTVTLNYENLRSIYFQRENHKLNEWSGKHAKVDQCFCQWVESLPYAKELILLK